MPEPKQIRVAIACNIKTRRTTDSEAEFDEPETVAAIASALVFGGYDVSQIEATTEFLRKLEAVSPDIVFNIAEGQLGRNREAQVPAFLDYVGVPYTGSDSLTLALTLNKAMSKRLAQSYGVKTPAFRLLTPAEAHSVFSDGPGLDFPVLVKPNAEGSSKGISDDCVAMDIDYLRTLIERLLNSYKGDILLEEYIDGREFTVGILGNGENLHIFEPMEIIYRKLRGSYKVYSYEVKQNYRDYISYECPPKLAPELVFELKQSAETIYQAFSCLDYARIDFRLADDGQIYFIEANPIPGLAPDYSDFPMLAAFNGIEYDELICKMLECALERTEYGRRAR